MFDRDCHVSLYCNETRCAYQAEIGSNCDDDRPCVNAGVCVFSKCVRKYSLANERQIDSLESVEACRSNFTVLNNYNWTCMPGLYLSDSHVCDKEPRKNC